MKTLSKHSDVMKVVSLGQYEFDLNLNITEDQAKRYKLDWDQVKSIDDLNQILQNQDIRDQIIISSKSDLINLLLFMNKTNKKKIFVEFLALNSLYFNEDFSFLNEKIVSDFDDYFVQFKETNCLPRNKFTLNLFVENKGKKSFDVEMKVDTINNIKNQDTNTEEMKKDQRNNENQSKETNNNDDSNKPKMGNEFKTNKIDLPSVNKPTNLIERNIYLPEGKDENLGKNLINYDEIEKEKQSPIILSKKKPVTNNLSAELEKKESKKFTQIEFSTLKYDFDACDYLVIDLNMFIQNESINLSNIYDYLCQNIIKGYLNTTIIFIFPNSDKVNNQNIMILSDLISISDIMIYDRRDALNLCNLLGYKVEDKNFEVRFMFLKEIKRSKFKTHRTAMFLDDFNKFTVVVQEIETNLIVFQNEFNFNIGFKMEYFKTVSQNYSLLRSSFLGSLLSRVVHNEEYDFAFNCGCDTFLRLLDAIYNKVAYQQDAGYFLINNLRNKGRNKENKKNKNKNGENVEKNFLLDSNNLRNSRLKPYDPLKDKNLVNYFQNRNIKKHLVKQGIKLDSLPRDPSKINNPLEYIKQEQTKYLNILEQNQTLQKKLVNLLSSPNRNKETLNSSMIKISKVFDTQSNEPIYNSRKLPGINTKPDYDPFQKIPNAPNYLKDSNKKIEKPNLKPLNKRSFDKTKSFDKHNMMSSTFTNPQLMNILTFMQKQQQEQSSSGDENSPDKMTQTGTLNPQIIQQFMSTMANTQFMNPMALSLNTKKGNKLHKIPRKNNHLFPMNSNSSKDLYKSYDQDLNIQVSLDSSLIHKDKSPTNERRLETKKMESVNFERKGQYLEVDNKKTLEQIQFEEEYKKKLEEKRKKEENKKEEEKNQNK